MSVSVSLVMWVVAVANTVTALLLTWVVFETTKMGRRITQLEDRSRVEDKERRRAARIDFLRSPPPAKND